jgi:hypothetical protein
MDRRSIALILGVGLGFPIACKGKAAGGCSDPPAFERLALPATLHIYKSETYLGAVTVPASGDPTFAAAPAPAQQLKGFREDFAKAIGGDSVSVKYETASRDTHYMCGTSVKKGTPEYADALRAHFYGRYYEVKDRAP